ncbi:MAG: MBL fold metallo-hydrolase [Prochlorococcus sp.]|jgi:glyoxylase-like metal-dependent hydrolase (beta-lactamase superfamily II)
MTMPPASELVDRPQRLREGLWVFPPNRDCNGGTAWWLGSEPEPVLIDCPPLTTATFEVLKQLCSGRTARILLTSREGHGRVRALQDALGWPVLVQEQEAYLLPGLTSLDSFVDQHTTVAGLRLLWTPGPTPGSCVVFAPHPWNVLFCGRLLIPVAFRQLAPLQSRRTFHWSRQRQSLEKMRQWIPANARPALASGAPLGAFRGQGLAPWEAWPEQPKSVNQGV